MSTKQRDRWRGAMRTRTFPSQPWRPCGISDRAGQAIPDADVLAFAMAEGRIVITLNRRHFIRLHHTTPTHTGIVVCTFAPDFVALAQRIHTALEAHLQMAGRLVRVNRPAV